jgi:hypothetical protein
MGDRKYRMWLVAAGAAVGMVLAGIGISAAQTSGSDTSTTTTAAEQPAPNGKGEIKLGAGPGGRGHRGPKGPGGFGKGAIHGEFTVKNGDDGYRTLATQRGEVTAVSSSSITVKSEDGFSRSYTVNDDTLVNAGNDGIEDVKEGDTVHVTAVVEDGKARAVDIHDGTQVRALRDKWMPERPDRAAKDSTTSTTAA